MPAVHLGKLYATSSVLATSPTLGLPAWLATSWRLRNSSVFNFELVGPHLRNVALVVNTLAEQLNKRRNISTKETKVWAYAMCFPGAKSHIMAIGPNGPERTPLMM